MFTRSLYLFRTYISYITQLQTTLRQHQPYPSSVLSTANCHISCTNSPFSEMDAIDCVDSLWVEVEVKMEAEKKINENEIIDLK